MHAPIESRQLRYFVAVAEELHFGRAADRLHISQSPLSRSIRDLERDLGVVLFVRTTRRVELTAAGTLLLERARRALAELDGAVAATQRAPSGERTLGLGFGPFSGSVVEAIRDELARASPALRVHPELEVAADALRRIESQELAAAALMESPAAARRHGVRIDTLRDEPLLAAIPASHPHSLSPAFPLEEFVAECILLPREPAGRIFTAWLRALIRSHGLELQRTMTTPSAPWDRRQPHIVSGEAVAFVVDEWASDAPPGVAVLPLDPPLSFPIDFASRWPPTNEVSALVDAALAARDRGGWLQQRPARIELPDD